MIKKPIVLFGKSSTAYELQINKLMVRVCFLKGEHWKFKPWRRISIKVHGNG